MQSNTVISGRNTISSEKEIFLELVVFFVQLENKFSATFRKKVISISNVELEQ